MFLFNSIYIPHKLKALQKFAYLANWTKTLLIPSRWLFFRLFNLESLSFTDLFRSSALIRNIQIYKVPSFALQRSKCNFFMHSSYIVKRDFRNPRSRISYMEMQSLSLWKTHYSRHAGEEKVDAIEKIQRFIICRRSERYLYSMYNSGGISQLEIEKELLWNSHYREQWNSECATSPMRIIQ